MGQRISLTCEKCGCRKELSVGSGLMSRNPNVIESCLNKEEAEKWHRLYNNNEISSFHAEQKVFYCDNCSDIVCLLSVEAELTDGSKLILGDKCKKCNKKLQEIKLQDHVVCPVCKNGDLSCKQIGLWD